ncbi:MAG TPA: hypothetical protein PLU43_08945, partial [Lachnospiraceae bacterium]|nr:hypothetical protein [Lachnospiraceae bacterium]
MKRMDVCNQKRAAGVLSLVLCFSILAGLTACGAGTGNDQDTSAAENMETVTEEETDVNAAILDTEEME